MSLQERILVTELIDTILKYESDTFSAEGSEISREEATKIAQRMIKVWIEHDLDGLWIQEWLDDIRDIE